MRSPIPPGQVPILFDSSGSMTEDELKVATDELKRMVGTGVEEVRYWAPVGRRARNAAKRRRRARRRG